MTSRVLAQVECHAMTTVSRPWVTKGDHLDCAGREIFRGRSRHRDDKGACPLKKGERDAARRTGVPAEDNDARGRTTLTVDNDVDDVSMRDDAADPPRGIDSGRQLAQPFQRGLLVR